MNLRYHGAGEVLVAGVMGVVASTMLGVAPVSAQERSPDEAASAGSQFESLRTRLLEDDRIALTDRRGRVFRGHLEAVDASSLVIATPESQRFAMTDILEVRRPDGVWDGMNTGFWIGIGTLVAGTVIVGAFDEDDAMRWVGYCSWLCPTAGAVSGLYIDAWTEETVYRRPPRSSSQEVRVSPRLVQGGGGVSLQVEF